MEKVSEGDSGVLYVVATPIGNLEDITFRAVKVLQEVDFIAAEDTRHTRKLFSRFHIRNHLISLNAYNEEKRGEKIIEKLKSGQSGGLVSNAGTPGVSDPGYRLVRALLRENLRVIPVPGCTAAVAGLTVSGLPTDAFLFKGFLPKNRVKKGKILNELAEEKATLIFYESPKRLVDLIENCIERLGDREGMVAREMTKIHEEYIRGSLSHILEKLRGRDEIKGECTLYIAGATKRSSVPFHILDSEIISYLKHSDLGVSQMAGEIAKKLILPKKTVYQRILQWKENCDVK